MNVYIIYTKSEDAAFRTIRIKATTQSVGEGKHITFTDNGKTIAVFNLAEIIGFVQEDHVAN